MWSWFAHMTNIMKGFANGEGAFGGVGQGTMEVIKEDEL
jgi:hypothetical protein